MDAKSALATLLSRHIGADNGLSALAIARELAIEPRQVRALVTLLREEGIAVCGHPRTGYFVAQDAAELELCCQFLRSRAMHSLVIEAALRRVPLPDLLGQLKLKT